MPATHLGNGQLVIGIRGKFIQHPAAIFLQIASSGILVEDHDDEGNATLLNKDIWVMFQDVICQPAKALLLHARLCEVLSERRNQDATKSHTIPQSGPINIIYNDESVVST